MSYGDHNPDRVPLYLEASSKDKLILLMQAMNVVNAKSYNFQTPTKEGSKWVVWFYGILGREVIIKEKDLGKIATIGAMIPDASNNAEVVK